MKSQQQSEPSFSINQAAKFWRKDRNAITASLVKSGFAVGKGRRFKIHELNDALFENAKLERDAKAARHQQQIDEAESARMDLELKRGNSMPKNVVVEGLADIFTKQAQLIRQSKLSEAEKKTLLDEFRDVPSKWEKQP